MRGCQQAVVTACQPNLDEPIEVEARRGGSAAGLQEPLVHFWVSNCRGDRPPSAIPGGFCSSMDLVRYEGTRAGRLDLSRQAIVSVACKMADVWPFTVRIVVRRRGYRSLSRLVILFSLKMRPRKPRAPCWCGRVCVAQTRLPRLLCSWRTVYSGSRIGPSCHFGSSTRFAKSEATCRRPYLTSTGVVPGRLQLFLWSGL